MSQDHVDDDDGMRGDDDQVIAAQSQEIIPPEPAQKQTKDMTSEERDAYEREQALAFRQKWQSKKKHIFIFSNAGKPIFSRYGDEQDISDFFGVMQAIVSFVIDSNDNIQSLQAGKYQFVFSLHGPLYFVMVACTGEPFAALHRQLNLLHAQILFHLTSNLRKLFEISASYDLRRKLGGTDVPIRSLISNLNNMPSNFLQSIPCLPLPKTARTIIGEVMMQQRIEKQILGVMFSEDYVVQIVNSPVVELVWSDLLLLMNYVNSNSTLRSAATHAPICLPRFNDKGMVYAYIEFIEHATRPDGKPVGLCLVFISTSQEANIVVEQASDAAWNIKQELKQQKVLDIVVECMRTPLPRTPAFPDLRHVLYRAASSGVLTMTAFGPPYNRSAERQRVLLRLYSWCRQRAYLCRPKDKLYLHNSLHEAVAVWVGADYELYCAFDPLTSKTSIVQGGMKVRRWLKQHEETLHAITWPAWKD